MEEREVPLSVLKEHRMEKYTLKIILSACAFLLVWEMGCTAIVSAPLGVNGSVTTVRRPSGRTTTVVKSPGNSGIVLVKSRPPKLKHENKGKCPSKNHVWIPGYWAHGNGKWHWKKGYWGKRPRPGAVYVPVRWVMQGNGWRIEGGYWQ